MNKRLIPGVLAVLAVAVSLARRDANLSTTFVVPGPRDLAAAGATGLRARLDRLTALADFESAQAAP